MKRPEVAMSRKSKGTRYAMANVGLSNAVEKKQPTTISFGHNERLLEFNANYRTRWKHSW